jgi:hypothetical protein
MAMGVGAAAAPAAAANTNAAALKRLTRAPERTTLIHPTKDV